MAIRCINVELESGPIYYNKEIIGAISDIKQRFLDLNSIEVVKYQKFEH